MITDEELKVAERVARKVGSRWTAVDDEDLVQELQLWLYENKDTVLEYRDRENGDRQLWVALRRVASRYCAKEQEAAFGAKLDFSPEYTTEVISRALPFLFEGVFLPGTYVHPSTGAPLGGPQGPEGSGVAQALFADLRGAFLDMPDEVQETLRLRFFMGLTYEEMGALHGVSKVAAKKRVDRALKRIQARLG